MQALKSKTFKKRLINAYCLILSDDTICVWERCVHRHSSGSRDSRHKD